MNENLNMAPIAHIVNDFTDKFGIPRQAGLLEHTQSRIVFEPKYRNTAAFRGLEEYDYIWLLWGFSESHKKPWSATVKPPRLGGKKRVGVFATRAPYRPNNIGLSSVKLEEIIFDETDGPVIIVKGADLLNGTPIYDIKPYLTYADSHPNAKSGFADTVSFDSVEVYFPEELAKSCGVSEEKRLAMIEILEQDPRPGYDKSKERDYKLAYGGYDIHFIASENRLTVKQLKKTE